MKSDVEEDKEPPPILKYIKTQVKDAFHAPLATLIKGAVVITEDLFVEVLPVAWELLLESNQEVAASAASLFIVSAVRAPNQASELMHKGLQHSNTSVRINAILRFQVLWKLRYQVWPRMEEAAHLTFKVPPPGIEFTLPSPKIGIESLPVVDPPWMPQVKTKVEEVTINQERHVSDRPIIFSRHNTSYAYILSFALLLLHYFVLCYITHYHFFHFSHYYYISVLLLLTEISRAQVVIFAVHFRDL